MESELKLPAIDYAPFIQSTSKTIVNSYPSAVQTAKDIGGILVGICIPLSVFFLIVIIYCVEQLKKIRKKESEMFDLKVVPIYEKNTEANPGMAKRWGSAKTHITSSNPNDWRQAIIDADIILDEILTQMGYQGQTVGDKLKRVAKGDFNTLDDAWEAHKVRNMIAHEGSSFSLNENDAKSAFNAYKRVFEEFYYV